MDFGKSLLGGGQAGAAPSLPQKPMQADPLSQVNQKLDQLLALVQSLVKEDAEDEQEEPAEGGAGAPTQSPY